MTGCFGLLDDHGNPYHFPPDRLIESRSRVDVWALQQCGALMDGATTELWAGLRGYQLATHAPNLWIGETRVLVIWDEQGRTWFECPACGRRCKHLYLDELTCRICLRLDYSSRHLHRTVPGIHRIRRLRQRIGADPRPFAPLPKRRRHHVRFHRIADEIRLLEQRLVGHLGDINRTLQRRIRICEAKGKW